MLDSIFFNNDNYKIVNTRVNNNEIFLEIKSNITNCRCPKCNKISSDYHSTYTRKIQDVPIHNKTTYLIVDCYEFECNNDDCNVKTFNETLPFARRNKTKTDALIQMILAISIFMSSTATSLILSLIGIKISPDSVDNILKKIEIKDNPNVEEVGIDDVAIRKGQTYATAIYDLKDHHMIALLEGRDASSLKEWLKNHQKIKTVARDRASAYASAISEVLPNCMQVADRFHLFQNLIEYLKGIFYKEVPEKIFIKDNEIIENVRKMPSYLANIDENKLNNLNYDNTPPLDENNNQIEFINRKRDLDSKQYIAQANRRLEKKKMVISLREKAQNKTCHDTKKLAEEFNIGYISVLKYLKMSDEEVENLDKINNYKKSKSKMDNYSNMIYKMLKDNIEIEYIMAYVIKQGCDASYRYIKDFINLVGKNNNMNYKNDIGSYVEMTYPNDVIVIKRYNLLKNILTIDESKKDAEITKYVDLISNKYLIVKTVEEAFKAFHNTMFSKDENKLDEFIEEYQDKLPSFCDGLKKDIAPVKNAISSNINSGFVEGNNNKFKLIKRSLYGKSNLVNLSKKSYLCFLATTDNFDLNEIVETILNDEKR